jgi:hypothetical protein
MARPINGYARFVAGLERMLNERAAVVLVKTAETENAPNATLWTEDDGRIAVSYGDGEDLRLWVTVRTVDEALDRLTRASPGWEWERAGWHGRGQ